MLRMILKDYGLTWKQGIKNACNNTGLFIYCYLLLNPSMLGSGYSGKEYAIYFVGMLGYFLTALLSRMFPNRLEETLYFCPMDMDKRRKYVRCAYLFRVLLPVAILGIVQLCMVAIEIIPFWGVFPVLTTVLCHGLTVNLSVTNKKNKEVEWMEVTKIGTHLLGVVSILGSVVLQMGLSTDEVGIASVVFVLVILLCLAIFSFHMVKKYFKIVLDMAVNYERL